MWLKTPDMYGAGYEGIGILDKKNLTSYFSSTKGYALWQKTSANGYFMLYLGDGANVEYKTWSYSSTLDDYDNTFYHLTITLESDGTVKHYFNGELKGTKTFTTVNVANLDGGYPLLIGDAVGDGASTNYNGLIDEVRIYNRVLSATQINALYLVGLGRHQ